MSDEGRDNDIESDGDKKAHHNALERKRRDHIKDSFSGLRDCVPALHGEKASRAQILKKAAEYIHHMRRRNNNHQHDIEDLKKQNGVLEIQIRSLEKSRMDEHYGSNHNSDNSSAITNSKGAAVSAFDGGSGTESSDSEKQTHHSSSSSSSTNKVKHNAQGGNRKKKLKTANHVNGS